MVVVVSGEGVLVFVRPSAQIERRSLFSVLALGTRRCRARNTSEHTCHDRGLVWSLYYVCWCYLLSCLVVVS